MSRCRNAYFPLPTHLIQIIIIIIIKLNIIKFDIWEIDLLLSCYESEEMMDPTLMFANLP